MQGFKRHQPFYVCCSACSMAVLAGHQARNLHALWIASRCTLNACHPATHSLRLLLLACAVCTYLMLDAPLARWPSTMCHPLIDTTRLPQPALLADTSLLGFSAAEPSAPLEGPLSRFASCCARAASDAVEASDEVLYGRAGEADQPSPD